MQPREEESRIRLVGQWFHKAQTDLAAAEEMLASERRLLAPACYHCQQAAEKFLKGFLTWRQVEFPKTHSIRKLLSLVQKVDSQLADSLAPAAKLTVFGTEVRYPGDQPDPGLAETKEALQLARQVEEAILRTVPLT